MIQQPRLTPGLLAILSFLAAVGPFAIDMYLAAFTEIAADLGTNPSSVQLTLTAFLVGMGIGQLVFGPLSDQHGRRPVLLIALSLFAASSVAMVFVPNIAVFVALRAVQGITGAAGVVLARTIAVDLTEGAAAIRAISLIAMFVGLGPLIAPPLGGALLVVADWRAVLAAIAVVAVAMLALSALFVRETLPREARQGAGVLGALGSFRGLLRDRGFLRLMLVFALGFGALMAYISASPFVGQVVLGMSPLVYALGFAAGALGLILANLTNARLASRVPPLRMLRFGTGLLLAAGAALASATLLGVLSAPFFVACAFVVSGSGGLVMSNASALALGRAERARGAGAALLGSTQFAAGGAASPVVGAWGEHTALPMAIFIVCAAAVAFALTLLPARMDGPAGGSVSEQEGAAS